MRGGPRYSQLPDHFVDSLRVIFDILDTDKTGYVAYEDICSRWRQLPTTQLPPTFLECLKRITPPNGILTFERFLAGIRISLLERRNVYPTSLHRVQSEGKLNGENVLNQNNLDKKRNGPAMGLNGFIIDRRPPIYQSQPDLVYSPTPPPQNKYSHSPKEDQYSVVLRPKKVESLRNGNIPAAPPLPNSLGNNNHNHTTTNHSYGNMKDVQVGSIPPANARFRPISSNSMVSNCSSGMAEIKWRNSRLSSSSPSTHDNGSNRNTYCEAVLPQVAKHEKLLNEEHDLLKKGIETSHKLLEWYEQRLATLDKRKQMLEKGMVALDSAVHEQKLNFVRAQITELNRRMTALISTSERGFPTHENMQIRNPIAPQTGVVLTGSTGSRSDGSVTPPVVGNSTSHTNTAQLLQKQNQRLMEELESKTRLIEQLQRDRRLQDLRTGQVANGNTQQARKVYSNPLRPAAFVRPAPHQNDLIKAIPQPPVKIHDTLL